MGLYREMLIRHADGTALATRLLDIATIWLTGQLAIALRFVDDAASIPPIYYFVLYFSCAVALVVLPNFHLYSSWRGRNYFSLLLRLAGAWSLIWLIGISLCFLIHKAGFVSRLWAMYWHVSALLGLILLRVLVHGALSIVRHSGRNAKDVLIAGFGDTGQEMYRRATANRWLGFTVKAIYTEGDEPIPEGISRITSLADIATFAHSRQVDEVWLAMPSMTKKQMQAIAHALRNDFIDIKWVPPALDFQLFNNRLGEFMGMAAIDLNRPPPLGMRCIVKEIFDRLFAALVLLMLFPLFATIAILIKRSSPGPVFFKQERLGLDGRVIHVYKFRSMKMHHEDGGTVTQACRGDSRVTPVGAFLRRTSLDELPQFINVLRGDMSVVGPRPHAIAHNDIYKEQLEFYMLRHRVKPGITGWAQINGCRGETDTLEKMAKRVEHDLFYIRNWSFLLDLRIILWTAFKGWSGKNAY